MFTGNSGGINRKLPSLQALLHWWRLLRRSPVTDIALAAIATYLAIRLLTAPLNVMSADEGGAHRGVFDDMTGFMIVWFLLSLTLVVLRQRWLILATFMGVAIVGFVAQRQKLDILNEPLLPSDLDFVGNIGFLKSQTTTATIVGPLAALVGAIAVAIFLDHRRRKAASFTPVQAKRRRIVSWALAPVLLISIAQVADFNREGNSIQALYDEGQIGCCPWSQRQSYLNHGFVAGFLSNLPTSLMLEPDGYSSEAIEDIAERYSTDLPDATSSLSDRNIVVVLAESFADPTTLEDLNIPGDPLATYREIAAESWYGTTLATFYGTGTSTMEYQVLTGQSMGLVEPQIHSPYQSTIASMDSFPSVVGWLDNYGWAAEAVHPYDGELYKRRAVYANMGFSKFTEEDDIEDPKYLGTNNLISDETAYDETMDILDDAEDPTLVNVIMMQNHVPHNNWYEDSPEITGATGNPDETIHLSTWIRGLEYSSEELADFLDELQTLDRPTTVIYYGDHYPPIVPGSLREENTELSLMTVPFLIWSTDGSPSPGTDLGYVGAADLIPTATSMVGASLPPYYRLLEQVQSEIGVIGRGQIIASDGTQLTEDDLSDEQTQLLQDYRMVQYDLSVGRQYGLDLLWYDWTP